MIECSSKMLKSTGIVILARVNDVNFKESVVPNAPRYVTS